MSFNITDQSIFIFDFQTDCEITDEVFPYFTIDSHNLIHIKLQREIDDQEDYICNY